MRSHFSILLGVLVASAASATHADRGQSDGGPEWRGVVLVSPSLVSGVAGNLLECRIVNLSPTAQSVNITSYDSNGVLVGSNTIDVQRNAWGGVSLPFENGPSAGYCKFSVPGGKRTQDFRASISVYRVGFGIIAALPAQ